MPAGAKENANKQGRTIVFLDESGMSERPTRTRTWAPLGKTPALQYHFNWRQLTAMAGITWRRIYSWLFPGTVKPPQVVEFLQALQRQLCQPQLTIWNGLRAHRSRVVLGYIEAQDDAVQLEQLTAYATELPPVEYM